MADKDPCATIDKIISALDKKVEMILNACAGEIKRRVDSQEFIHWKSGRKPIVIEKAKLVGNLMVATVRGASRWTWGNVLIGPAGTTTITAKSGMLAIPTDAAKIQKFRGGAGYSASARQYGNDLICFAGVLWGKAGWGTGSINGQYLRQRRAAGEVFRKQQLVPLFVLKGSVVVRRRVIPAELIAWIQPIFLAKLKDAGLLKEEPAHG